MFELIVSAARYYFLALIALFLFFGVGYVLAERGHIKNSGEKAAEGQFTLILLLSGVAYPLLAYRSLGFFMDLKVLLFGMGAIIFLTFAKIVTARAFKNSCPLLWNSMLFLLSIGFISICRLDYDLAVRQLIFCFAGFLSMVLIPIVLKMAVRFQLLEILYLAISLGLLIAVSLKSVDKFGAKNWITLYGISFQPSEIVKLSFVFYLASALRKPPSVLKLLFVCCFGGAVVILLASQRDLGGALIFFMTFMIMLYCATGNLLLFISGFLGAGMASYAAYTLFPKLFSHVETRVAVWLNPWQDVADKGYQLTQSLFAICTWGPFGSGLNQGLPANIPVVERDFIFSAICEEFGSVFGLMLIGVFLVLFYRGVHIALRCKSHFNSLLSVGLTGILAFQTFVIIGGDIKLIPMTGVTLPFVSYGGTSVFISVIMVGILEWLYSKEKLHISHGEEGAGYEEGFEEYGADGENESDRENRFIKEKGLGKERQTYQYNACGFERKQRLIRTQKF